ncbi:MAG: 4Fe-4S binding protein [Anaerolineae bacterium]|nr:4Fe-4S binding protein [Anaerolineae bacterium]
MIYKLSIRLWPLGRVTGWLAKLPVLGPYLQPRLFDPAESQAIMIPVHEAIQGGDSVILPYTLLPALVQQASHRAVLNHCMCREAEGCQAYPQDLGCLFLGEGATQIDPSLGRLVDVGEALAHVERAMDLGLMPTILHSSLDAFMLQIPFRRMLAICFCCDCCCTIRKGMRMGPPAAWQTVTRLPGLTVAVADTCTGCGRCMDRCPVEAISLSGGRAIISEQCKGCGACVAACPVGAISLQVADGIDVTGALLTLVEARTNISEVIHEDS